MEPPVEQGVELPGHPGPVVGDLELGALVPQGAELLVAHLQLPRERRTPPGEATDPPAAGAHHGDDREDPEARRGVAEQGDEAEHLDRDEAPPGLRAILLVPRHERQHEGQGKARATAHDVAEEQGVEQHHRGRHEDDRDDAAPDAVSVQAIN